MNTPQWRDENTSTGLDLRGTNVKRVEVVALDSGDIVNMKSDNGKMIVGGGLVLPNPTDWIQIDNDSADTTRAYGPMIRILATTAPLIFVIGFKAIHHRLAIRLAHDIFVYHRTDVEIIDEDEAMDRAGEDILGSGNLVVLGSPHDNAFAKWMMDKDHIPGKLSFALCGLARSQPLLVIFPKTGSMEIAGRSVYEKGAGESCGNVVERYVH